MDKRRSSRKSRSAAVSRPTVAREEGGRHRFEVDIWHKARRASRASGPRTFVCTYVVDVGLDLMTESAWLIRHEDRTELWTCATYLRPGVSVVDHEPPTDDVEAAAALIDIRIRAGRGHESPVKFVEEGLLTAERFAGLCEAIRLEAEATRRKALEAEKAPIVATSRELGLSPEPTPEHHDYWYAACPMTNHRLMLRASTSEYYCGYCKCKGGPEDLRALARSRQEPKPALDE